MLISFCNINFFFSELCFINISQQVAGVVGRADLLCALFFCLCFLSYCRAVRRHSLPLMLVSTLLCACSMLCKELGVTVIVSINHINT